MNKDTARDYLPLVQALSEGKVIQYFPDESEGWIDCEDVNFMIDVSKFRVKPEPMEIWRNRFPNGIECGTFYSQEEARRGSVGEAQQVRYREVIE